MTLALQSLVGLTLLVCGATAALPALWLHPEPRTRAAHRGSPAAARPLWVVRSPARQWFLNGEPITATALARRLAAAGEQGDVRFLPSAALPMEELSRSLRWLRRQGGASVVLDLPGGR